jgi:hypothetical protein
MIMKGGVLLALGYSNSRFALATGLIQGMRLRS